MNMKEKIGQLKANEIASKLLPCPFCGGVNLTLSAVPTDYPAQNYKSYVCCDACDGRMVVFGTKPFDDIETVAEKWNRRTGK